MTHDGKDLNEVLGETPSNNSEPPQIAIPSESIELPEFVPFPVDQLPEPARSYVIEDAKCKVIEPAMVALPVLVLAGWWVQVATGADNKQSRLTLRGLPGIGVVVEGINPDAERDGLTRRQLKRWAES